MAYHWAISPLLTDSIASLQTCAALEQYLLCGVKCSFGTVLLNFVNLSKMTQGDTPVGTRDLSNCCRMLYLWAMSLSHGFNTITANECSWRQLSIMFVLRSQTFFCDCASHLYNCVQNYIRGHPDSNQGAFRLQLNALPLSYIPSAYRFNNITANTCRLFEHCYNVFCSESSVLSRSMSIFSILSKIIQGDTRVRTRNLSHCRWMLYHWVVFLLHAYSITSPQKRAGCLTIVTMFFVPSQVFSRDRCHFSLVFQKLYKGTPGFEPGTSRTAAECSTTELYSRCMHIQ